MSKGGKVRVWVRERSRDRWIGGGRRRQRRDRGEGKVRLGQVRHGNDGIEQTKDGVHGAENSKRDNRIARLFLGVGKATKQAPRSREQGAVAGCKVPAWCKAWHSIVWHGMAWRGAPVEASMGR